MGKAPVVYEVQRIVGVRLDQKSKTFYQVKWRGYAYSRNSWEPEVNLSNVRSLINQFYRQRLLKTRLLANALRPTINKLALEKGNKLEKGTKKAEPGKRGRIPKSQTDGVKSKLIKKAVSLDLRRTRSLFSGRRKPAKKRKKAFRGTLP